MKTTKLFGSVLGLFLLMNASAFSQDLKTNLAALKQKIGEVKIDQTTYRQSFEALDAEKGKINYTSIEVDINGKAKKESYEFYISDIDKNTIIRNTSGKKLFLSVSINNNQKFIKHFVEDQLDSYVNKIDILIATTDIAQEVTDLIKNSIPLIKTNEKSWATNTDALTWLKTNIGQVTTKSGISAQSFSFNERKNYLATLSIKKTDAKGTVVDEKYEFNVLDINKNNLTVKISGTQLVVNLEIIGNEKYIKCFKNNELQSYDNSLEIVAQDIDQARNIISAFGVAITKSKAKFQEFTGIQQAIDYLKSSGSDINIDGKLYKQKLDFVAGQGCKADITLTETDAKGKSEEIVSSFYLTDLEVNSLNFKVSGKKVMLICNTKNKIEFIKTFKDKVLQNYEKNIEVFYSDIEIVREVIEAFKYSCKASELKPMTWNSVSEAILFLSSKIKGETILTDQYKLTLTADANEPYKLEYVKSKTDAKAVVVENQFILYPYMLDANTTKIKSSGKYLSVIATVANKNSYVKVYKDGKQQSYDNELEIMAYDSKQAKDIAEALKYIIANAKPKAKDWSDKKKNMDYVKNNIGNLKGEGIEIKQKIELIEGNPCKINLTVNTIDDKGKTLEEIYEFNLSDMNKLMVEYKISGKNVNINLVCKNKEKFIKVYKNGLQQSYSADVTILDDDVEDAKNLADAIRSSIIMCEQQ